MKSTQLLTYSAMFRYAPYTVISASWNDRQPYGKSMINRAACTDQVVCLQLSTDCCVFGRDDLPQTAPDGLEAMDRAGASEGGGRSFRGPPLPAGPRKAPRVHLADSSCHLAKIRYPRAYRVHVGTAHFMLTLFAIEFALAPPFCPVAGPTPLQGPGNTTRDRSARGGIACYIIASGSRRRRLAHHHVRYQDRREPSGSKDQ